MDHYTLYLLDLWDLDDAVQGWTVLCGQSDYVWNKINNLRRDNSVTQPDRILHGKKGWDN